ncbi:MAG: hypothetical protein VX792_13930 [Candidatus Latescibacterota bacterium]|nr:hypothetical protein [Candidatus Latescibacterota bacterium]
MKSSRACRLSSMWEMMLSLWSGEVALYWAIWPQMTTRPPLTIYSIAALASSLPTLS